MCPKLCLVFGEVGWECALGDDSRILLEVRRWETILLQAPRRWREARPGQPVPQFQCRSRSLPIGFNLRLELVAKAGLYATTRVVLQPSCACR